MIVRIVLSEVSLAALTFLLWFFVGLWQDARKAPNSAGRIAEGRNGSVLCEERVSATNRPSVHARLATDEGRNDMTTDLVAA